VGRCIKAIRETMGWNKKRMASETGTWAMSDYENGTKDVTLRAIERIREVTGLDPYVLAYFLYYDFSREPEEIQVLYRQLRDHWKKHIEIMRHMRHMIPGGYW